MAISARTTLRLAFVVPRWAVRFSLRYFLLVVGLALLPGAIRLLVQLIDLSPPPMGPVTTVTHIVLVGLVIRYAIATDSTLSWYAWSDRWRAAFDFCRTYWPSLLAQIPLLSLAIVLLDLTPDLIADPFLGGESADGWAILLAVKNPVILAFTLVWFVGAIRQAMLSVADAGTDDWTDATTDDWTDTTA